MIDDFGNAAPSSVPLRRKLDEQVRRNNQIFERAFKTPDGGRVLKDLMDRFYKPTSIVPNDVPSSMAKCGQREVVAYILHRIEQSGREHERLDGKPAGSTESIGDAGPV